MHPHRGPVSVAIAIVALLGVATPAAAGPADPEISLDGYPLARRIDDGDGPVALLRWDVVERGNDSLTVLLHYRYDGAHGEAWIGAQPLVRGQGSRLFGYRPSRLAVGVGVAQVHVLLRRDRPQPICTGTLEVAFYGGRRNRTFHEVVLSYRYCWRRAGVYTDALTPRSRPERGDLKSAFGR